MWIYQSEKLQVNISMIYEKRDIWIGIYIHELYKVIAWNVRKIYICILPLIPIKISIYKRRHIKCPTTGNKN